MPVAELKAVFDKFTKASDAYNRELDDGYADVSNYSSRQIDIASNELRGLINEASEVEVSEFLKNTPGMLRSLAYQPDTIIALINKVSSQALNQGIQFITREFVEKPNPYRAALLTNYSDRRSSEAVIVALLAKENLELLMEQQRKTPYSGSLLNTDSFYNEDHEIIIPKLIRIFESDSIGSDIKKKALYCLGSMALTLSTRYTEKPYLFRLAFIYIDSLNELTPLLKAHKTKKILYAQNFLKNKKDDQDGASYLILTAQYLEQHDKRKNKKALISTLEKLNKYEVPPANLGLKSAGFHLRMAEVLKMNLALFNKKKSSVMLNNALNYAEMARDAALKVLGNRGWLVPEGFDCEPYEATLAAAEKIIIALRSDHQGRFSAEEKQTRDVITALENKILNTDWKIKNPLAQYPSHVKLMLKEINAYKTGLKSDAAALRGVEEIARKAAAHEKFLRDPETMKFYQAMSSSQSRNNYLQIAGVTQHRDLLFNQRARDVEAAEPGRPRAPRQ